MRTYWAIFKGAYMTALVYRFGYIFTILTNIIYLGVAYYLWRSIYQNTLTLRGLTFDQTFIYVALGSALFVVLKNYTDWFIAYDIREGTITNYLIKPVDLQLYFLASTAAYTWNNLALITLPTLLMLALVFQVKFAVGIGLAFFPAALALAFLISFAFDYMVGLVTFYTESIWGLSITKEIIITLLSGALIPLQFYPESMQQVLRWLPFQAVYHTPLMMITDPSQPAAQYIGQLALQAFWVVALFILSQALYSQAIKVVRISGG